MSLISRIVCAINKGREEAKLRAAIKLKLEEECIAAATEWAATIKVCTRCGTTDGVIGSHEDCMDIILDYCHDPHLWHASHIEGGGTYKGVSRDEALARIGKRIMRGSMAGWTKVN